MKIHYNIIKLFLISVSDHENGERGIEHNYYTIVWILYIRT